MNVTVALLSQGIKEDENKKEVSILEKIHKQTTETKLNKTLFRLENRENDKIEKSFNDRQKGHTNKRRTTWQIKMVRKKKISRFFSYMSPNHEKATKIDSAGNIKLTNGKNATILGSKGSSTDGNHKFIKIFRSQVGDLFKGGDNKWPGDINDVEIGGNRKH